MPGRSSASGSEVVQIVETAFSAVRAERDEARDLLHQVTDGVLGTAPNGHRIAYIAPDVMERIERLASRTTT